ncbi:MAG TPA: YraN family protein [Egibacteraceae bacterium]|nr:YraN family protein [Egibacteraceae bacterium]
MGSSPRTAGIGRIGEQIAARHLERAGLTVVERNWRCADGALRGELDIVAVDGRTLVVCEVKARRRADADDALEAVTPRKQRQLRLLATAYAAGLAWRPADLRIDVVAVWWPVTGGGAEVLHLRGVGEP